jgi:hypothetical protein
MVDDAANPSAAPPSPEDAEKTDVARDAPVSRSEHIEVAGDPLVAKSSTRVRWQPGWRIIRLVTAFIGMCAIITVDVVFMVRSTSRHPATMQPSLAPPSVAAPPQPVDRTPPSVALVPEATDAVTPTFGEDGVEGEPSSTKPEKPRHFRTVQDAASRSCSTASVEGLSRQIINEARCINPNAFVPLPSRPNLVLGSHVFPFLDVAARDHLMRVLDAHRDGTMTINSALRTVAQQYLVWRWSANKRCGVQLATPPGDSNHESGLAVDIAEETKWRPALEAQEFHWLGAGDRVHFDYKGSSSSPHRSVDVQAFQRLWNRNHTDDSITSDGNYSPATEQRLKKAPPDGFRIGPNCAKSKFAKSGN